MNGLLPSLSKMTGNKSSNLGHSSFFGSSILSSFIDTLLVRSSLPFPSLRVTLASSKWCSFDCANRSSLVTASDPSQLRTTPCEGTLLMISAAIAMPPSPTQQTFCVSTCSNPRFPDDPRTDGSDFLDCSEALRSVAFGGLDWPHCRGLSFVTAFIFILRLPL